MKIMVTSQGSSIASQVDPRFGRTAYFIELDEASGKVTAHDNEQNLNAAQGAGIQAGQRVVTLGADVVLTGSVGPKAFAVLQAGGIQTYIGASGTVENAVNQFKAGQLACAQSANVEGHWV